jgi:transposase
MAGRFEGLSDLEWKLFADLAPPREKRRGRMGTPLRKIINSLLYILITGSRWCDIPAGPQWAAKSVAHRALKTFAGNGFLEKLKARVLGLAEERGIINWCYGAIDGSFSPWEGRW